MWSEFNPKTEDQGIATHVYTAFSPDLEGKPLKRSTFDTDNS